MSDAKQGAVSQIKRLNRKGLYKHCFGYTLNVVANNYIRKVDVLNDNWVMIKEFCNLAKRFPSRLTKLVEICENTQY